MQVILALSLAKSLCFQGFDDGLILSSSTTLPGGSLAFTSAKRHFGTPTIGKRPPLTLRLMLRTIQPIHICLELFYLWRMPPPDLLLFWYNRGMILKNDPKAYAIMGCAIKVHSTLGDGFLESAYGDALEIEFKKAGIPYIREDNVRA